MKNEPAEDEDTSPEAKSGRELKVPQWLRAARKRIEDANNADEFDFLDPPITATARRGFGHAGEKERRAAREAKKVREATAATEPVPGALKVAADYSWRIAVVALVTGLACWALAKISILVIPMMVAALLAGLLLPVKKFFVHKLHWPNGLGVATTFLLFLAVVVGALYMVFSTMARGAAPLVKQTVKGVQEVQRWLSDGPWNITASTLNDWLDTGIGALTDNTENLVRQAASGLSTVGHFGTGLLLTLFALIFFLLQGETLWRWTVGLFPRRARPAADGAGRRGWASLVSYVRVQVVVAVIDGVGIGIGAAVLQVPLALPLGVLVVLGSFIPIIGAVLTGFLAVLLALVAHGWVVAWVMLAVVLFVQQVESHILQPLIMGRAVSLHPLAVVLSVTGGTFLFGIVGALFAVPVMAVLNTVVKYLATRSWERDPAVRADLEAVEALALDTPPEGSLSSEAQWPVPDVMPSDSEAPEASEADAEPGAELPDEDESVPRPQQRSRSTGTGAVEPLDGPD